MKIGHQFLVPLNLETDDFEYMFQAIGSKLVYIKQNPLNNLRNMIIDNFCVWTMKFNYQQIMIDGQLTQLNSLDWQSGQLFF